MDQLYGIERAAARLGVHPDTIRHVVDGQEDRKSLPEELVDDLLAIVTSFAGKLYGLRSHKKARELVSAVKAVVAGVGDVPDEDTG